MAHVLVTFSWLERAPGARARQEAGGQHATSGLTMGANKPQDAHITAVVIRESGAAAVGPAWVRFARCLASVRLCLD